MPSASSSCFTFRPAAFGIALLPCIPSLPSWGGGKSTQADEYRAGRLRTLSDAAVAKLERFAQNFPREIRIGPIER
jgi:hypothetical protein